MDKPGGSELFSNLFTNENILHFASIPAAIRELKPNIPIHCWHLKKVKPVIDSFIAEFPGSAFCAIKANPSPKLLNYLYNNGIKCFDVASLNEVKLVRSMFPDALLAFMNPIKNREAIRLAYFNYNVKNFSLDSEEELKKILEETNYATDLGLHVRMAVPKGNTAYDISGNKFGANEEDTIKLLHKIIKTSNKAGICFHVGSQITDPNTHCKAISFAANIVKMSGVKLSVFDIGGGFPAAYPGSENINFSEFFTNIKESLKQSNLPNDCEIWCEPGRAFTGPSQSLVVQIQLRKGEYLYINDGVYGSLFESCDFTKQNYPAELVRLFGRPRKNLVPFKFFGPTCDSVDRMAGPFYLPEDAKEGDWIILHEHGAYGTASMTKFNGFYSDEHIEID